MSLGLARGSFSPAIRTQAGSRRRWIIAGLAVIIGGGGVAWWRSSRPSGEHFASPVASLLERGSATDSVTGRQALETCARLLRDAQQTLSGVESVQAVFHKQERIDGALQPPHIMEVKVRRTPLSVYLRWREPDEGQEIIWRDGAHDGQMVVHPGGWRGRLLASIKIDPEGDRAKATSRRPIKNIGPWSMTERLAVYVEECLQGEHAVEIVSSDARIGGRDCHCFQFTHPQSTADLDFKQVVIYIDKEQRVPIAVENYGWGTADGGSKLPLEESYVFNELTLNAPLTDLDFDLGNPSYCFGGK